MSAEHYCLHPEYGSRLAVVESRASDSKDIRDDLSDRLGSMEKTMERWKGMVIGAVVVGQAVSAAVAVLLSYFLNKGA